MSATLRQVACTGVWCAVLLNAVRLTAVYGQGNAGPNPRNVVPAPGTTRVVTLPQNWTDADANWFYNVPQGSKLIPYNWFLKLEQPGASALFSDAAHFRSVGYITRAPDDDNPDGLPIGFVRDGKHLGLTCAACHTNVLRFQQTTYLIDGAPTLGDFETLLRRLATALAQTNSDAAKFQRFADRVLGPGALPADRAALQKQLQKTATFRGDYNDRNLPQAGSPGFGPGRVDAFGAIMNEVSSTFGQLPLNHFPANAPVSYPFLWDTPQHDKVQWNGAAKNEDNPLLFPLLKTVHVGALGRNVGEVMGVFGEVDAGHPGITGLKGYGSTVRKDNLIQIEERLRNLWSPLWPPEFGAIVESDRLAGKVLFHTHCAQCHDENFSRTSPTRQVQAKMDAVDTDPVMASNFATRTANAGLFQNRLVTIPGIRRFGPTAAVSELLVHTVQRVVIGPDLPLIGSEALLALAPKFTVHAEIQIGEQRRLVGDFTNLDLDAATGRVRSLFGRKGLAVKQGEHLLMQDESSAEHAGRFFSAFDEAVEPFNLADRAGTELRASLAGTQVTFSDPVPVKYQYKGRPLNGIWATAPYLHNGSVPNLDELLKAPANRAKTFQVGSREFDAVHVGFRNEGDFTFDTSLPGNSNLGHDYARTFPSGKTDFTPDERRQLIAFLKSL